MTTAAMCGKNSGGVNRLSGKRLLIYCAGGLGREILELARQSGRYESITFLDDSLCGTVVNGVSVSTLDCVLQQNDLAHLVGVVASGEPSLVRRLIQRFHTHGVALDVLVHPSVYIPESTVIHPGAMVQDRVFLGPNVELGEGSCVDYASAVGHDVWIGAYAHLSMGCMVAGHVTIGDGTYVGAGTVIRDEVTIGKNCIIGMGSLVTKDIPDNVVAYGSPCRVVRENTDGIVFR